MPYVLERSVASLGLKAGDKLKHKQGKLPSALKFDAVWQEELEQEAELEQEVEGTGESVIPSYQQPVIESGELEVKEDKKPEPKKKAAAKK